MASLPLLGFWVGARIFFTSLFFFLLFPRARLQVWAAEPDEKEKYWFTMEQINKFPEADRKRFFNFAYEVAEGVWSSA